MKKFYQILPYFIKVIIINAYGFFIQRKRYSKKFFSILKYYLDRDKEETQNLNVKEMAEALKGSTCYNVTDTLSFFSLPLINKETLRKDCGRMTSGKNVDSYLTTGGTTGSAMKFPVSKDFIYHQWAVYWKFRIIHGLDFNDWCAYFMGKGLLVKDQIRPPYWIYSYPTRQLLMSLVHLNSSTVKIYLERIKKSRIRWIHAYPSVLNLLASLVQEADLKELARSLNLKIITTGSELMLKTQKKNIEDIFGCKVRELYGLTEGVANIFECEHSSLHVDESFSYVEFIREPGSDDLYRIVGSQFKNKALPLLRYDTEDLAVITDPEFKCPCGRNSRVIKEIVGRVQDYLLLEDNSKAVSADLIFRETYNIIKAQIVQRKKGCAEFYIVRANSYTTKDEELLKDRIRELLGKNFNFEIIYTNELRTSAIGKARFIINETGEELKPQQI